ncbi:hypothetical protein J2S43_003585 [Catenuloplanes nepalensis]|uniref:GPP34 family phosphoprotein n=1 Tax=Catenuloplanes nepalensis TaxID=587533 RepID=A0ABT9MUJ6_9ACTN|nr:GPP34 family phosphoprotein [Catenuloplanes nepalensis]MDP9795073.1 hypothetical protein [Catenuloplanes nepalensis]
MPISHHTAETLPHQFFLLSHHPEKGRLDDDSAEPRGSLLCAAAVAELCTSGLIEDRDGRAVRTGAPVPAGLGPFVAAVLGDVPADRPRRWLDVLEQQRWWTAEEAVRDELAAAGVITVERRRFRSARIHVADPGPVRGLRDRVRAAARNDPGAATIRETVLAVLAIEGAVNTVFGWRDLWGHKPAVRALRDRFDRELPGLREAAVGSAALRRTPAST